MRKFLLSLAAVALVGGGAPALAKKGGHGAHKAHKHRGGGGAYYGGYGESGRFCPPGLAKKGNGCLPPGQARKLGVGDRLPDYLHGYNIPDAYQGRYRDNGEHSYRYEDDRIYRVNRDNGIIDQIISVLGF